ncbi:hypothetical protein SLW70_01285 [Flavobacterium sp. NG2]|uniref:hypothetical protein n=1 Tax=Flavobacterium sp. NG2 TaxID=3097547 RepID=UPI002A7FF05D|nr:hypothetical protein [Flavobacterium sp. NG2]WPR71790.1 hypothetical protein SLW70_01285 [Flavobacterium sp. NG2]
MELEEIFNEYILKSEQLIITKRSMNDIAQNEIKNLNQKKEKEQDITGNKNSTHSMDFFFIQDVKSGETTRYKNIRSTVDEKIKQIVLQKNKQYQWILSESFEIFREFLIKSYAYLGYKDKNIWPLKDYGSIILSEIENKDYSFFLEQTKTKRDVPESILNIFRNTFPEYKKLETCNKLDVNLNLEINLIEHFRHIIVHCGGKTDEKHKLIEKIIKKSGLWNNGKYDSKHYDFISSFFRLKESNDIILLEIESNNQDGFPNKYYDVLSDLMNSLNSVAYLIVNEIKTIVK